jgi:hypothetical protein
MSWLLWWFPWNIKRRSYTNTSESLDWGGNIYKIILLGSNYPHLKASQDNTRKIHINNADACRNKNSSKKGEYSTLNDHKMPKCNLNLGFQEQFKYIKIKFLIHYIKKIIKV